MKEIIENLKELGSILFVDFKRVFNYVFGFVCIGTSIVLIAIGIFIGILAHGKGIEFNYYLYWFPIAISPFGVTGTMNIILGVLDTTRPVMSPFSLQWRLAAGLLALTIHAVNGYKLSENYNYILLIPFIGIIYFAYQGKSFVFSKDR